MSGENTRHFIIFQGIDRISNLYKKIADLSDKTTLKVSKNVSLLQQEQREFSSTIEKSISSLKKIGQAYISIELLYKGLHKVYEYGKKAVDANAQVEQFSVALQTMLGNKQEADVRMREYMDIAAKTPFELQQVVDAGNKLQALGRYSRENLTMLGDLAAATSKPIDQVMGAYAKLASGQKGLAVDMFRDLLITTKDWQEATGKGIKSNGELLASTEEMISALPKILAKKGFAGMMAAQSKTVTGQISNMHDAFFQLQAAIGERMRPSTLSFVQGLTAMADKMKKIFEIPLEEKIRNERNEVNRLVIQLTNSETPLNKRRELYAELAKIAPDVVKNIKLEGDYISQLTTNLIEYNRQSAIRILAAKKQKEYEELISDAASMHAKAAEYADKLTQAILDKREEFERRGLKDAMVEIDKLITSSESLEQKFLKLGEISKKYQVKSNDMPGKVSLSEISATSTIDIEWLRYYEKKAKEIENRAEKFKSNIDKILGLGSKSNNQTLMDNEQTLAKLNENVSEVSSLGGVKNFNININRLIEKFEISTTTIRESQQNIKELVLKALMEAINDSQMAAV